MENEEMPTNAQLAASVKSLDDRVKPLEQWKIAEDAYRAALAQVKQEDRENKAENFQTDAMKRGIAIMKQVGVVLGLVAAILYAYAATKGVNLK